MSLLDTKVLAARAMGGLARRAGRGGTSLPGKMLVALDAQAIQRLASRLARGSVVISATNGKTTTAAMVSSIMERAGIPLVHNRAGANMAGGVASALLGAARSGQRMDGELGCFEVDEFWLDRVLPELRPRVVLLGNLFRDQLDRYGELETIAARWANAATALPAEASLALNADDPLIADLGRQRSSVSYFGVEDSAMALAEMQHASDSKHCSRCGAAYTYDEIYLGHLGRYHCPACGQTRPDPEIVAETIRLDGTRSATFALRTPASRADVRLPLPGVYNVYNALGAAALTLALGIDLSTVVAGLESVSAAFGRAETLEIAGRAVQILLVKNPAGANEILRTLALEPGGLEILAILNDRTADGRDVSWIWDADLELVADKVSHVICAGTRAPELALRLKYAGVPEDRLETLAPIPAALDRALARPPDGPLFVLPTYTALLELRRELSSRGHTSQFWEAPR